MPGRTGMAFDGSVIVAEKVCVAVLTRKDRQGWDPEDLEQEMCELVKTAGGEVADRVRCPMDHPTAPFLIGRGKAEDLAERVREHHIDTVVFSEELKGSQQRNLEEIIPAKTLDRTQLILDIFARHARSREGKCQVELAQLEYLLPRLVGKGIALSRLGGGIGTLGPGETKLEVDRRRISARIARLRHQLNDIAQSRALTRKKRKDKGIPLISLVGYTNAGKSTLLNCLVDARQATRDGLFTTLDPLARQLILPHHQRIVLSDTVGFIHELPQRLINAFMATLEEVVEADLWLHVVDASHPRRKERYEAVERILKTISGQAKPTLLVLNKMDQVASEEERSRLRRDFREAVFVSARTGAGKDDVLAALEAALSDLFVELEVVLPIQRMDLVHRAHEDGQVYSIKYYNDRIYLRALLPAVIQGHFRQAAVSGGEKPDAGKRPR